MLHSVEFFTEWALARDKGVVVVRPLRKIKLDGTLYHRRPAVEAEIQELTG